MGGKGSGAPVSPHCPDAIAGTSRTRVLLELFRQAHPTVRSIGEAVGISPGRVQHHLDRLEELGLLTRDRGRPVGKVRGRPRVAAYAGSLRLLVQEVPEWGDRSGSTARR